jgi:hypothetical protein
MTCTKSKALCTGLILIVFAASTAGCAEENLDQDSGVTSQGTVDLNTIKLGTSDQVFQEAVVSFVRDPSAQANSGGKRQYLSRGGNQAGQYMVEVKDGSCFEITLIYKDKPVSREAAEFAMKKLLPEGAPPQSRVDDSSLSKPGTQNFEAVYYFGDEFLGVLSFVDKSARLVKSVKVSNISLLKQAQLDNQAEKENLKPLVDKARAEEEQKLKQTNQ